MYNVSAFSVEKIGSLISKNPAKFIAFSSSLLACLYGTFCIYGNPE